MDNTIKNSLIIHSNWNNYTYNNHKTQSLHCSKHERYFMVNTFQQIPTHENHQKLCQTEDSTNCGNKR